MLRDCLGAVAILLAGLMCRVAVLAGQEPTATETTPAGSIEGHVFVRMQSGETRPLGAVSVALIPSLDEDETILGVPPECRELLALEMREFERSKNPERERGLTTPEEERRRRQIEQARRDSVGNVRADLILRIVNRVLNQRTRVAMTDINAHYVIDGVPPGEYILYSEASVGERKNLWWLPVSIGADSIVSVDLHNFNQYTRASLLRRDRDAPPELHHAVCDILVR